MAGHVLACPHCRRPVATPAAPAPPPAGVSSLHVQVSFTRHGFDSHPDRGASVLLIPAGFPHKVPIWVVNGLEWEVFQTTEEGQRICRWASDCGIYSATADFNGGVVIEGIKPGPYHLVILSYAAHVPADAVLARTNPTPAVLSRFFEDCDHNLANDRQVVTDTVTLSPGESVVRMMQFHIPANQPAWEYDEWELKSDERRNPRPEPRVRRERPSSPYSILTDGCFIAAVVGFVLFVIAFTVLPQLLRGR
jgi:hypothetical protein